MKYIEGLKAKETEETIETLNKTAGAWKNLVDAERLKKNIYADRLITTRLKVAL